MVWYGMVWYGMVWYGMVWCGVVWYWLWKVIGRDVVITIVLVEGIVVVTVVADTWQGLSESTMEIKMKM